MSKKAVLSIFFAIILTIVIGSVFTVSAKVTQIEFVENSGISVEENLYFTGIPENTTAADILSRVNSTSDVILRDHTGVNCPDSVVVGTGYKLALEQYNVVNHKLEAVIAGDVSGDGKIAASDYIKIKNSLTGNTVLSGAYFKAGDINGDNRISSSDYIRVKKHITNDYNLHKPLPEITPVNHPVATANPNTLGNSVEYANQVKNQIDTYYPDKDRTSIVYENATMKLTHGLIGSGEKQVQEFANKDGGVYFTDTFVPFIQNSERTIYLKDGADTSSNEGTPAIRFGYYYYQNEIRNVNFLTFKTAKVSEIFNVLPNSLRVNQKLIVEKTLNTNDVYTYGNELKIAMDTVLAQEIKDANGTYTDISNFESESVEYVAFDIKDAGVVALIFATDSLYEKVTVTVENGFYVIRSTMTIASFTEGQVFNVALQLYNDTTHDFTGARKAAILERNPISVTTGESYLAVPESVPFYDSTTGLYRVKATYRGHQHAKETRTATLNVTAINDEYERPVYIHYNSAGHAAMATGIVRGGNGNVVAIPSEFCRNFSGDDAAYEADNGYGDMIYPLYMEKNESITTIPTIFVNNWGNTSLIQFSSIQYYFMYSHSSKNASETTCIKPTGGGYGGGIVADFRGVSGDMWPGSNPQFNHAGNFYFVNENNVYWNSMYRGMNIESAGPNYVDVSFDYVAESGNYEYTLTHKEFPYDDETRNYYTIDITFLKDVTYTDATRNFQIFQYYTSMGDYSRMSWKDADGVIPEKNPRYTIVSLDSNGSFFTFFNNVSTETENVGMIIKDYSVIMSGKETDLPIGMSVMGRSRAALVFNQKTLSFKAGDRVTFNIILLPYGNPQQGHCENVLKVYNDSVVNPITTTVSKGSLVEDAFMPKVYADNNQAEFTLSGGADNVAVKIDGFTSDKVPVIEEYVNGNWVPYVYYSDLKYDGYNIYYNDDNTYGFTYTVPMGTDGSPRTFRINQGAGN